MLEKTQLAYIAGIIDGEGCITIIKHKTRCKSPHYQVHVVMCMCDPRILEFLNKNFGGSFRPKRKKTLRWRKAFQWSLVANQAIAFLRIIRPWLVLKAEEADIAIELQKDTINRTKKYGTSRELPKEVLEYRENLRQKITQLKRIEYS